MEAAAKKVVEETSEQRSTLNEEWDTSDVSDKELLELEGEVMLSSTINLGVHHSDNLGVLRKIKSQEVASLSLESSYVPLPVELDLIFGTGSRRLAIEFHENINNDSSDEVPSRDNIRRKRSKKGGNESEEVPVAITYESDSASVSSDSSTISSLEAKKIRLEESLMQEILWDEALTSGDLADAQQSTIPGLSDCTALNDSKRSVLHPRSKDKS